MIEPRQIRAARALLNWSQTNLAEASGVAVSSIKNIENNLTVARRDTIEDIMNALENAGVQFLPNSGVSQRPDNIIHIKSDNAFLNVLEDVAKTFIGSQQNDKEALFSCVVDSISPESVIEFYRKLRRDGIKMRSLIREGDTEIYGETKEYRCIPEKFFHNSAQVIYKDKVATILLDEASRKDAGAIIIRNAQIAEAQKNLFEFIWQQCNPPIQNSPKIRY